ncbi:unnamed protein product [Closterium sp. NIES-53]
MSGARQPNNLPASAFPSASASAAASASLFVPASASVSALPKASANKAHEGPATGPPASAAPPPAFDPPAISPAPTLALSPASAPASAALPRSSLSAAAAAASAASAGGAPSSAATPGALAALVARREKLEEQVASAERQLFDLETAYLHDSSHTGSVLRGFDSLLAAPRAASSSMKRPRKFLAEDRLFSLSSCTSSACNPLPASPCLCMSYLPLLPSLPCPPSLSYSDSPVLPPSSALPPPSPPPPALPPPSSTCVCVQAEERARGNAAGRKEAEAAGGAGGAGGGGLCVLTAVMPCHAVPCHAMPCRAMPCFAMPSLKCFICVQHGDPLAHTSYGAKGDGARDLQIGSIRTHSATRAHKQAVDNREKSEAEKAKQATLTRWQITDSSTRHIIRLLHIALFVCTADAPIAMFVPLCCFLAKDGLPYLPPSGGYGSYYNDYGFKENLRTLSTYLQETQRLHLLESPWIGISLDESTDRVHGKHLILYTTFFKRTSVVTEFLTLITVDRADAASLTSAVVQYLTGIRVDLQKISSVASDGANMMVGKNKGVMLTRYCVSLLMYKEALAASDAADAIPELRMIDNVVRAFAEHIGRSCVHYQKFHELQRIFCPTNLEAQGIHEVRWLSRGEAVQRLLDVLPAAVVDYKELYEAVTLFKFHWLIRFLADVLWELNALNKRFQQRQADVTLVAHIVEQTRMRLKTRYSLRDPAHHFGSEDKMQLPEFIKRHQAMDKREMKAEGVDEDGNPVHFVYERHERRLPGHETDGNVTACVELLIKFVRAVDAELEWRMCDLNLLEGTKLFRTASYVSDDSNRVETFKKWLGLLHKLHNHKLPGKP